MSVRVGGVVQNYFYATATITPTAKEDNFLSSVGAWLGDRTGEFMQFVFEAVFKLLGQGLLSLFNSLIDLLNQHSVDIIAFAILICGIGMIVAPAIGSDSSKWFGRALFVSMCGAIWRVVL